MTISYYQGKLAAERLKRCYDIAPPRVQQYLRAEIDFVRDQVHPGDVVLDMGAGYGRAIPPLARKARLVLGIDISLSSLVVGTSFLRGQVNCFLLGMDAGRTGFFDESFDAVVCIQNGISAFRMNPALLISEGLRVLKKDGVFLISTYSDKFWESRLNWFELQSKEGLIGEIDWEKTANGTIACKDGFRATTLTASGFLALTSKLDVKADIVEVDDSSLFCIIKKKLKVRL
ncbi:MAG: class I SAM-dependent methyltransferase [Candidatus Aminicenantales bacterium]